MADRLSKSLDELIAEKNVERRPKGGHGGGGGGGGRGGGGRGRGASFGVMRAGGRRGRNLHSEPYNSNGRPGFEHDDRTLPKESRQAISAANSAIPVNPFRAAKAALQQPSGGSGGHASVFTRIGSQQAPVGGKVRFKNLRETVDENDMQELCNTVGDVTSVEMKVERNGRKTAFVVFASREDATKCIEKFNGER